MKNDTMTTFLNIILAALVIFGVFITLWNARDTHLVPIMNYKANYVAHIQGLTQDLANYNAQAKNPDLAAVLQIVEVKPAAH